MKKFLIFLSTIITIQSIAWTSNQNIKTQDITTQAIVKNSRYFLSIYKQYIKKKKKKFYKKKKNLKLFLRVSFKHILEYENSYISDNKNIQLFHSLSSKIYRINSSEIFENTIKTKNGTLSIISENSKFAGFGYKKSIYSSKDFKVSTIFNLYRFKFHSFDLPFKIDGGNKNFIAVMDTTLKIKNFTANLLTTNKNLHMLNYKIKFLNPSKTSSISAGVETGIEGFYPSKTFNNLYFQFNGRKNRILWELKVPFKTKIDNFKGIVFLKGYCRIEIQVANWISFFGGINIYTNNHKNKFWGIKTSLNKI